MRNATLGLCLLLLGCMSDDVRDDAGEDARRDAEEDAEAPSATGRACEGATECDGIPCVMGATRSCEGPVRAHEWTFTFPGGSCTPTSEESDPGMCAADSQLHTVITGCDGLRFRFCAPRCETDDDCRHAEGYFCEPEAKLCLPPDLAP